MNRVTSCNQDAPVRPEDLPEVEVDGWRLVSARVTGARQHLRKRLVAYDAVFQHHHEQATAIRPLVAKYYGRDRGANAHNALRQLWGAGFRQPAAFRVPRPYGYWAERGMLLQEQVPGRTWSDAVTLLGAGTRRSASSAAAEWLARLQATDLTLEPSDVEAEVSSLQRFAVELASLHPDRQLTIDGLVDRVLSGLGTATAAPVPSHGDFHADNVLVTRRTAAAIDLDHFGLREPAFDVGYALAQLVIVSTFRLGDPAAGVRAGDEFWRRYRAAGGRAQAQRVGLHAARAFLHSLHYELCVLHRSDEGLVPAWSRWAHGWLDGRRPDAG